MHCYPYTVRLRDTDAAGLLYFAEQLRIAHEAFEDYFASHGLSLAHYLDTASYLLPVVHAEADFKAPLAVGDRLGVHLACGGIGDSSLTFTTRLERADGSLIGTTSIVHAAIDRATGKKVPVPDEVKTLLDALTANG